MKSCNGFTLIELLVVVAIIAVLAAILFPVFARVRDKARQAACLSNEKQIGLAFQQYLADYDGVMPVCRGWAGRTYPYTKSLAVFSCPDDPGYPAALSSLPVSYMVNNAIGSGNRYASEASWTAPSRTILAAECEGCPMSPATVEYDPLNDTNSPRMLEDAAGPDPTFGKAATGAVAGRPFNPVWEAQATGVHADGSDWIFCDGHARWLRGSSVSSGLTNTKDDCNQDNAPAVAGCTSPGRLYAAGTSGTFANGVAPAGTFSPL